MKPTKLDRAMFWNPLIIGAINPVEIRKGYDREEQDKAAIVTVNLATFQAKLAAAKAKCGKYAVPALDYPKGEDPKWGFTNTSKFIPRFSWMDRTGERMEKDFRYWWPKSCFSGKPLRWAMSVNLGSWYWLLNRLTAVRGQYSYTSPYGTVESIDRDPEDTWLHFFVDLQNEFDNFSPDCAIVLETHHSYEKDKQKYIDPAIVTGEGVDLFRKFQDQSAYDNEVSFNPPCDFLAEPILRFQKDSPEKSCYCDDDPEEMTGVAQVFGRPNSQQSPKRFISPNQLSLRACAPVLGCNDSKNDVTHQFYMDTWALREFESARHYCKLDSSCT